MSSTLDAILARHCAQDSDTTNHLLGATFTVLSSTGQTLYTGSSGRSTFSPASPPYSPKTITWIASMTKLITATALLQLVSSNRITLDEDIRPHLPRLAQIPILTSFDTDKNEANLTPNTHSITLRHLLTHTSGLIYDLIEPDVMRWHTATGREINNLSWSVEGFSAPLVFAPGEAWKYGTSIDWAGLLLESVTGQTLGEYMKEHIFHPLGMSDTTFWPASIPDYESRKAAMAFRPFAEGGDQPPLQDIPYPVPDEHEVESGGAGLYSTLEDYSKFVAAIMRGDERILGPEARELLFTPQLNDQQRTAMKDVVGSAWDMFACEYPEGTEMDFGFGGMINMEDIPGRRRKGSVMWSGLAHGHWVSFTILVVMMGMVRGWLLTSGQWIDRQSGIAGILSTTVMREPPTDPIVKKLYIELEEAVYAEFGKK